MTIMIMFFLKITAEEYGRYEIMTIYLLWSSLMNKGHIHLLVHNNAI